MLATHRQLVDSYHDLYRKANALKLELVPIYEELEAEPHLSDEENSFLDWLADAWECLDNVHNL